MVRNYLKGRDGDRINAVLAAAGYNFGLLLRCLARFLRALFQALITSPPGAQPAKKTRATVLHSRLLSSGAHTKQKLSRFRAGDRAAVCPIQAPWGIDPPPKT